MYSPVGESDDHKPATIILQEAKRRLHDWLFGYTKGYIWQQPEVLVASTILG